MHKSIPIRIGIALAAVMVFCSSALMTISARYKAEANVRAEMSAYRPQLSKEEEPGASVPRPIAADIQNGMESEPEPEVIINPSILQMQEEVNPDIIGWLNIEGTAIDYAFVQGADNAAYLHSDVYKADAYAGSIFMDYRCSPRLEDFNTILYGHNMKNGSMFGGLRRFADDAYFNSHNTATVFLPTWTYTLRIFAYLTVRSDDSIVYNAKMQTREAREAYIDYLRENSGHFTEPGYVEAVMTLSTCSYEYEGARIVLVGALERQPKQ